VPEVFIRRKMYAELGGYVGYMATPVRELQEIRLSIIAELTVQDEQEKEFKHQQEEREREMERLNRQGGRR
jgi:hypothetical protein